MIKHHDQHPDLLARWRLPANVKDVMLIVEAQQQARLGQELLLVSDGAELFLYLDRGQ